MARGPALSMSPKESRIAMSGPHDLHECLGPRGEARGRAQRGRTVAVDAHVVRRRILERELVLGIEAHFDQARAALDRVPLPVGAATVVPLLALGRAVLEP